MFILRRVAEFVDGQYTGEIRPQKVKKDVPDLFTMKCIRYWSISRGAPKRVD